MKYEIRQAEISDGENLLELIESEAARGDLELIYTRRPNPVLSYQNESSRISLGVIKDQDNKPCFMEACVMRDYYLKGEQVPLTYVCGVRKKPGYSDAFTWLKIAYEYESRNNTAWFCSILNANRHAVDVFCRKKRKFFPQFTPICEYTTFLINPAAMIRRTDSEYTLCAVQEKDLSEIYSFLGKEGQNYEMFPVVRDITSQFSGITPEDCFMLKKAGTIVAFGSLWDQKHYRQYIVKNYGGIYRYVCKASALFEKIGYIRLPPVGDTADVLTLALMISENGDRKAYRELMSRLAREALKRGCPIIAAGIARNNHYYPLYKSIKSIGFDSTIFAVEANGNIRPVPDKNREMHMECGWL